MVALEETLSKAEVKLVRDGGAISVLEMRADLTARAETILQRKVVSWMSANDVEASRSSHVFVLEPEK